MGGAYFMAAAAAAKVASSVMGGRAQKKALKAEGDAQYQEALAEAKRIRRSAAEVRSAARAGFASSGVVVDDGTPAIVDARTTQLSEEDALNTILTGKRRQRTLRAQGKSAQTASYFEAGSSAMQSYSSMQSSGGGWRK